MKYFSNLHAGWADLKIDKFKCRCSYIQNIPFQILNAWEEYQNNGYCVICIDGEGIDYEIIFTENGVKTFTYDNSGISFLNLNKFETHQQKYQLLKDLVDDIVDNIEIWSEWLCISDEQNEKNKYRIEMCKKIKFLGLEKKGE